MRSLARGLMPESAPMPTEAHPGIPGWLPPYHVKHAPLPLSRIPERVQGIPRRFFTRSGVRPALTALSATPPVFAYLLAHVKQTPKRGINERMLVAQVQAPIGVWHE